jgi:hypothetical protein
MNTKGKVRGRDLVTTQTAKRLIFVLDGTLLTFLYTLYYRRHRALAYEQLQRTLSFWDSVWTTKVSQPSKPPFLAGMASADGSGSFQTFSAAGAPVAPGDDAGAPSSLEPTSPKHRHNRLVSVCNMIRKNQVGLSRRVIINGKFLHESEVKELVDVLKESPETVVTDLRWLALSLFVGSALC